jgi:Uma2 family endonuclease
MAETLTMESPPHTAVPAYASKTATKKTLFLEERTDVTVEELERASLPASAELYDGKVVFKMPNPEHGMVQTNIAAELRFFLRQNPLGSVMTETNFRLWPERPRESRIPDVVFLKKDRLPKDLRHFPELAPDLAVEIISPEDNFSEVMDKVDAYLEQGTQVVWLIMCVKREALVCTASGIRREREKLVAPDLLPGFELPLTRIFEDVPLQP